MYIKLDCYQFADRMAGDFSRDAAKALFSYLEELEAGREEQEFDSIAISRDYSEYDSATKAAQDHGWELEADWYDADDKERDADEIAEENEEAALKWLNRRTSVIEFSGGVIIQQF